MQKVWKPADARTWVNMHLDRFQNRFGAFTSAICFRNLNFWEMRMVSALKWSKSRDKCLSGVVVAFYSFLNNS